MIFDIAALCPFARPRGYTRRSSIRALKSLAIGAALFLASAGDANAFDLHVATNGDDRNAGSPGAPLRTVRRGLDVARGGDTILLHVGTYAEAVSTYDGEIHGGTSWEDALTIAAFPGDTVVLEPPRGSERVFTLASASASYIVIRGLVMDARNVSKDGVKITESGSGAANSSHHIRIEDSEVVNAPGQGLLIGGHHNELLRLRVHGNGVTDFQHGIYITSADNLVDGCEVYQNAGWGVHVYNGAARDADRNVVRNNRVRDNARVGGRGAGIVLSSGENNLAFNNVVFGNKVGIQVDYAAAHSRVYNNTVFAHAKAGIEIGGGATDTDVRNNLLFSNSPDISDAGIRTTARRNLTGADPGVVDATLFDVHLRISSPAIDTGETIEAVPFDCDGVPRPVGRAYDVGACEYRPPR